MAMHAVAHRERTRVSSYRSCGMHAGIRYDGWRRNASDSRGPGVPPSRPRRRVSAAEYSVPFEKHELVLPGLREFRDLRHRYRDYTVRDEAIKVIPNRRPVWIKLRRVRDLNASSDCGLFWTLAGEEVANALRAPLRRLQIDPG